MKKIKIVRPVPARELQRRFHNMKIRRHGAYHVPNHFESTKAERAFGC